MPSPDSQDPAIILGPGGRSPRLPAARRRRQLLDVALERFAASGYHATSMEEIAERAGVTKPVLYQHFPSKRDLYRELLESVGAQMLEAIAAGALEASEPRDKVTAGFTAYFSFVTHRTNAFLLLFDTASRRSDDFSDVVRGVEDAVAATIAAFIDADIDRAHRELLAFAIVGLAEVTARRWIGGNEPPGQETFVDRAVSLEGERGQLVAVYLADLVWAGLRALPGRSRSARPAMRAVGPPGSPG